MQVDSPQNSIVGRAAATFEVTDGILALTLYLAGNEQYVVNCYTPELLRKLGYRGLKPTEAAMKAVVDGQRGKVRYVFRKEPPSSALKSYSDQERQFSDDVKRDSREVLKALLTQFKNGTLAEEDFVMRLGCLMYKIRIAFMNQWKSQVPFLRIENPGEVEHTRDERGGGTIDHPGYTEFLANSSDEMKKRLGVT